MEPRLSFCKKVSITNTFIYLLNILLCCSVKPNTTMLNCSVSPLSLSDTPISPSPNPWMTSILFPVLHYFLMERSVEYHCIISCSVIKELFQESFLLNNFHDEVWNIFHCISFLTIYFHDWEKIDWPDKKVRNNPIFQSISYKYHQARKDWLKRNIQVILLNPNVRLPLLQEPKEEGEHVIRLEAREDILHVFLEDEF